MPSLPRPVQVLLAMFALAAPELAAGVLEDRAIEDLIRRSFVLQHVVSDPTMVQVFVGRGAVELRGQVAHEEERRLVGDALARLVGVARVDNRLFVDSGDRRKTARWKADRLRSHLMARGDVELTPFVVRARDDAIELGGTVRTAAQRDALVAIAQAVAPPFAVRDLLEIDPGVAARSVTVDDASVAALVHETLAEIAGARIAPQDVASAEGRVTLDGAVVRIEDVARAARLAAAIRGVRKVENRVVVRP